MKNKKQKGSVKVRMVHVIGHRAFKIVNRHKHFKDFPIGTHDGDVFGHEHICDSCGTVFEPNVWARRYDTPSGELEVGNLYWDTWTPRTWYWKNQEGPYLCVVLPNKHHWNIDSRASNCTMPNDQTHRCWVRHGDPETGDVNVDKRGRTCKAGAGSIKMGDFHGFLRNGYLIK